MNIVSFIPLSLANFAPAILASDLTYLNIEPIISEQELPSRQSKFLGIPYWPKCPSEYPTDSIGNNMKMLVQINFDELNNDNKTIDYFPFSGIIQFFISQENLCINFPHVQQSKVIYHLDSNLPNLADYKIIEANKTIDDSKLPIMKHCKLDFQLKNQFCSLFDSYSSNYFYSSIIDNLTPLQKKDFITSDEFQSAGCKINGYSNIKEQDFLAEDYDIDNPRILILQIDGSNHFRLNYNDIFNNCITSWFIFKNDLVNKDFSKITFKVEYS